VVYLPSAGGRLPAVVAADPLLLGRPAADAMRTSGKAPEDGPRYGIMLLWGLLVRGRFFSLSRGKLPLYIRRRCRVSPADWVGIWLGRRFPVGIRLRRPAECALVLPQCS